MGAVGYIFTEGARKQGEIRLKIGDQGIFCRCGNVPKKQVFGMDGQGCQRGQRARNFSKFRGAQGGYGYLQKIIQRSCHIVLKKSKNKQVQIDADHCFV